MSPSHGTVLEDQILLNMINRCTETLDLQYLVGPFLNMIIHNDLFFLYVRVLVLDETLLRNFTRFTCISVICDLRFMPCDECFGVSCEIITFNYFH